MQDVKYTEIYCLDSSAHDDTANPDRGTSSHLLHLSVVQTSIVSLHYTLHTRPKG